MNNAVATRNGSALANSRPTGFSQWDVMWHQAATLVKSGFLPTSIKTPEQAIAIMLTGEELGIPKMLALRSINVIQGKPTLSADLMVALVQRAIDANKDGEFRVLPPSAERCTVNYRRWGWKEGHSFTYTIEDAKRANLLKNPTWTAHPGAMLRARATSTVCRMAFSDVIAGIYVPEELETIEVPDHGFGAEKWESHIEVVARDEVLAIEGIDAEEAVPEDEDIIDAETGEIETVDSVMDDIKTLSAELGFDGKAIQGLAKSIKADYRTIEGAIQLRSSLLGMVPEEPDADRWTNH